MVDRENEDFFPLTIYVSDPEVEKLGLTGIAAGDERILMAKVRATSVSVHENEKSKNESVTLALIEGEVIEEKKSQADTLFKDS